MSAEELQVSLDPLGRGVYINGVLYEHGQRWPPEIDVFEILTILSELPSAQEELARRRTRTFEGYEPFEL
ncbi:MAG TPA: hypothetical protein VJ725_11325 [Thermoanaerobaculia bacterium]|nr:hypothetical protein [Thermoanaerobaculia bacterium]